MWRFKDLELRNCGNLIISMIGNGDLKIWKLEGLKFWKLEHLII